MLPLQLFTDFSTGQLGGGVEQENAASISRLIIAGNLIGPTSQSKEADASYAKNVEAVTVASMRELDEVWPYFQCEMAHVESETCHAFL